MSAPDLMMATAELAVLNERCEHKLRFDRARKHATEYLRTVIDAAEAAVEAATAGASEENVARLVRRTTAAHEHLVDPTWAEHPDPWALAAFLATQEGQDVAYDAARARTLADDALAATRARQEA